MELKTSNSADRRVQRTRRTLREALIGLILERPWDDISVSDVCARADVGRSTFYTHFADKEDLLTGGFDDLQWALRAQHPISSDAPVFDVARGLIEHAHEHRDLFRAIVGRHSGHVVQQRFRQLLVDLIREDIVVRAPQSPLLEATIHYVAGALFGLLLWWLETQSSLPPSELDEHFHRLTAPVLAAACLSTMPAARATAPGSP
jgi:AcrR family transcriptional regulator